jgi:hypothetical protein
LANPHIGHITGVHKHLCFAEVLVSSGPSELWESHAGAADYSPADAGAAAIGLHHVLAGVRGEGERWPSWLTDLDGAARWPGSAALTAQLWPRQLERARLFELDEDTRAGLRTWADARGAPFEITGGDGLAGVTALARDRGSLDDVLVFLDPFVVDRGHAGGPSALQVLEEVGARGAKVLLFAGWRGERRRRQIRAGLLRALEAAAPPGRRAWASEIHLDHGEQLMAEGYPGATGASVVVVGADEATGLRLSELLGALLRLYERAPSFEGQPVALSGSGWLDWDGRE